MQPPTSLSKGSPTPSIKTPDRVEPSLSSNTRWYQERAKEGYYKQAKKEGYRARSAYKLKQIDEKYSILGEGDAVVDLGCAPGGWTQVLVEAVGLEGLVLGVDLQRTKPVPGARFIQADFTRKETHERMAELLKEFKRDRVDAVVSDMAPDMSGEYDVDQARSVHLAELALRFAETHLREGGAFVCKVFEGVDFQDFRDKVRKQFRHVYQYHPPASRRSSSEIYLVAKGYRSPRNDGKAADEAPVKAARPPAPAPDAPALPGRMPGKGRWEDPPATG